MKPVGRLLPLLCAVAALATPAGAAAKARAEVHPGRYLLAIELPKSHGWQMSISASSHDEVELNASRGAASVAYRAPGRVSSHRVEADFGSLGRIDLKLSLQPRGTGVPRLHGRCTGRSPYELVGSFHGTVDFPGEPNVAGVSAHQGKAAIERTFQHVCRPLELPGLGKGPPPLETDVVAARSHENGRTTAVAAVRISIEHEFFLGLITGSVSERVGTVQIARSRKGLIFEEEELRLSKPGVEPLRAEVKPSWPFRGTASFLKPTDGPARWEGDLSVRVPGGGRLALAGPAFDGIVCRLHAIEELTGCADRLQSLQGAASSVLDLYGSGSHSQPLALASNILRR